MSRERRESYKCGLRLFLCLKGSDKFEQEVFEALYGNQSRRDSNPAQNPATSVKNSGILPFSLY